MKSGLSRVELGVVTGLAKWRHHLEVTQAYRQPPAFTDYDAGGEHTHI